MQELKDLAPRSRDWHFVNGNLNEISFLAYFCKPSSPTIKLQNDNYKTSTFVLEHDAATLLETGNWTLKSMTDLETIDYNAFIQLFG